MSKLVEEAVTEYAGERCPDFDPDCIVCKTWAEFDRLKQIDDFLQVREKFVFEPNRRV